MPHPGIGSPEFRALLKQHRRARGWSQPQLAEAGMFDESYISRLETGGRKGRNPTRESTERLSRALGLTPAEEDQLLVAAGYAPNEIRSLMVEPLLADIDNMIALLPDYERDTIHNQLRGVMAYSQAALARYEGRAA